MDFSGILSKAWQFLWKFKALWLFGVLAGCGSSAASSAGSGSSNSPNLQYNWTFDGTNGPEWWNRLFQNFDSGNWGWLVALFVIAGLVIGIILAALWLMGTIGLIKGTQMADTGAEKLTVSEIWNASTPYFWRMLGLSILLWVLGFLAVLLLIALTVGFSIITLGVGLLCLLPLLCLLVPVGMLITVVVQQAYVAVVVDDLGVMDGLRRGWEVVRENFWNYALLGLIVLVGVMGVGGFLAGLPLFAGMIPLMAGLFASNGQAVNPGIVIGGILLLCAFPISIFLNGLVQTFAQAIWTLAYLRTRRTGAMVVQSPEPVEPLPPVS